MHDRAKNEKSDVVQQPARGGSREKIIRRTFAERIRAVKLHLEEGFTISLVAQEMDVSGGAVDKWLRLYRDHGEEGLKDRRRGPKSARLPEPVRAKIIELKKEDPTRGIKRISQLLKRVFSSRPVRRRCAARCIRRI
jgi:transposase-like protein